MNEDALFEYPWFENYFTDLSWSIPSCKRAAPATVLQSLWFSQSSGERKSERRQQSCALKNTREPRRFLPPTEVSRHIYSGKVWLMTIWEQITNTKMSLEPVWREDEEWTVSRPDKAPAVFYVISAFDDSRWFPRNSYVCFYKVMLRPPESFVNSSTDRALVMDNITASAAAVPKWPRITSV